MAIAGELVSSRVSPERVNRSQVWNLSQNWLPAISVNQSAPKQTPSAEMGLLGLSPAGAAAPSGPRGGSERSALRRDRRPRPLPRTLGRKRGKARCAHGHPASA